MSGFLNKNKPTNSCYMSGFLNKNKPTNSCYKSGFLAHILLTATHNSFSAHSLCVCGDLDQTSHSAF